MSEILKSMLPPWALIIIVLGTIFLILTRNAWNKVINEGALKIKHRFFDFTRKGEEQQKNDKPKNSKEYSKLRKLYKELGVKNIEGLYSLFETNKKSVEESKVQQNNLFLLWKNYMFSFFNLFLVVRSKLALVWLYNNPNSTREMFCLNIIIPTDLVNKELEREAVFNALIAHSLIEKDNNDLYKVSNIGIDFLKFIGLIKLI